MYDKRYTTFKCISLIRVIELESNNGVQEIAAVRMLVKWWNKNLGYTLFAFSNNYMHTLAAVLETTVKERKQ